MQNTSELIQTLTTGITADEGHENGYREQLQGKRKKEKQKRNIMKYINLFNKLICFILLLSF